MTSSWSKTVSGRVIGFERLNLYLSAKQIKDSAKFSSRSAHGLTLNSSRFDGVTQVMPPMANVSSPARFIPNPTPCGRSRRQFLWEVGGGFAGLGLIDLLSRSGFLFACRACRGSRWRTGLGDAAIFDVAQAAALSDPGQARRLPLHERRSQPGRHVRPQAGAREIPRLALPGQHARSAPTAGPSAT